MAQRSGVRYVHIAPAPGNHQPVSVGSIRVAPGSIPAASISGSVKVGAALKLTAYGFDLSGALATVTGFAWSSSNAAVAAVDQSGNVTGISAGTATISAKIDGITGTTTITVTALMTVAALATALLAAGHDVLAIFTAADLADGATTNTQLPPHYLKPGLTTAPSASDIPYLQLSGSTGHCNKAYRKGFPIVRSDTQGGYLRSMAAGNAYDLSLGIALYYVGTMQSVGPSGGLAVGIQNADAGGSETRKFGLVAKAGTQLRNHPVVYLTDDTPNHTEYDARCALDTNLRMFGISIAPRAGGNVVMASTAAGGATALTVAPLPISLPNGTVLTFLSGKTATLNASFAAGATAITCVALAAGISAGDSAPVREPGQRANFQRSADHPLEDYRGFVNGRGNESGNASNVSFASANNWLHVGIMNGFFNPDQDFAALVICRTPMDATSSLLVQQFAVDSCGAYEETDPRVVEIGDSIGQGTSTGDEWATPNQSYIQATPDGALGKLESLMPPGFMLSCFCWGGESNWSLLNRRRSFLLPLALNARTRREVIVVIQCGTNDIKVVDNEYKEPGGAAVASTNLKNLIAWIRTLPGNIKIVVRNVQPCWVDGGSNPADATEVARVALNTAYDTDVAPNVNAFVDSRLNHTIGDPGDNTNNTYYFLPTGTNDLTHMTVAGYALIGADIAAKVAAVA